MPAIGLSCPARLTVCARMKVRHFVRRDLCYGCAMECPETDHVVAQTLAEFIDREILGGEGTGLTDSTALLELGILDSFSLLSVINFMNQRYGIQIDLATVDASDLATLSNMASLVRRSLR